MSEAVARAINKLMRVPCVIYIDDTIIIAQMCMLRAYEEAVDIVYRKLGFWVSESKTESMLD